ncbi:MAG: acetylxylan esterase [Bryobacterales bacterium]|nr:acetylxylan esterase [Bryobacteraceae bacterium]MDW8131003.1 acetylxylan esterase [Bryobacterales bacterium]
MRVAFLPPLLLVLLAAGAGAQPADVNYDESRVPGFELPDPLALPDGRRVADSKEWFGKRRVEILRLYETWVYGRCPAPRVRLRATVLETERNALGGRAVRKQILIPFSSDPAGPRMHLLIYLPARAARPVPLFLGLNFTGNHAIHPDPGIRLAEVWVQDPKHKTWSKQTAPEKARGATASRWPLERILERGYGLATAYYGDIEPDFDGGIRYGVRPLFFRRGQTEPAEDEWGAIGAWAWGLSRALDYLETDRQVDARRVAVIGHSRLGKTALWAAAQDTRFAMAISNNSGEGGAAITRRRFGEQIHHLNARFPHWFCRNFRKFDRREDDLPVDAHMLLALIAPRPVYVASAEEDRWADPRGEFLALVHAAPVYRLLGRPTPELSEMPPVGQPVMDTLGYHIRSGKHDITEYDWEQYLNFADRHLKVSRR